jgi:hypothetical protein
MTPYRLTDRLYEPTSWAGLALNLIGYYISQTVPATTLTHIAEFLQTVLATGMIMFPENRMGVAAETILKVVAAQFPPSGGSLALAASQGPAASFGDATLHPKEAGFANPVVLMIVAAAGLMALATSACSTPPTPAEIQAVQSISSELACTTQAAANAATAGFEASGDTKNAQITSAASAATGSLCTGLSVGEPLTTATPVK